MRERQEGWGTRRDEMVVRDGVRGGGEGPKGGTEGAKGAKGWNQGSGGASQGWWVQGARRSQRSSRPMAFEVQTIMMGWGGHVMGVRGRLGEG